MYGDPTSFDHFELCGLPSAIHALASWAPDPRTLGAYAERLNALCVAEFVGRASSWPAPASSDDAAAREALIVRVEQESRSGLLRWRLDDLIQITMRANEEELHDHRILVG